MAKVTFKSYEGCDRGTVVHDYAVLDSGHNLSRDLLQHLVESTVTMFEQMVLIGSESDLGK